MKVYAWGIGGGVLDLGRVEVTLAFSVVTTGLP